ncbi:MAG: hypothetical protein K2P65_03220 [Lachnospiraceae bacterium]|nr:hypothetical protein [Lachnospiraceae bacterium]
MAVQVTGASASERNMLVHQNENAKNRKDARVNETDSEQVKNGSINMNELDGKLDSILMRKEQAQKKALKVVGDAWDAERKIDMDLAERRTHIEELDEDINENMDIIDSNNAHKAELQKTYGVSDDSQEQKDLELMEKARRAKKPDTRVSLTKEEKERLKELDGKPLTEYQQRILSIDNENSFFEKNIEDAQEGIRAETGAIRAIKLERLKDHGMVDALKEADEINADASKDIIGMLVGEAQDHVDETLEDKREEAEDKAEEKEEQEEKLEEEKTDKEIQQEELEIKQEENQDMEEIKADQRQEAREQAALLQEVGENIIMPSSTAAKAQVAIKEMLQRMKLLEEDLKGAKVDAKVEQ